MPNYTQISQHWYGHSVNDTIPSATGKTNHRRTDTDTGKEFYSDGTNWIEMQFNSVVTKTSAYTATDYDDNILVDATTAAFTITLPTAVGRNEKRYRFKKIDNNSGNAVIIDPAGTETIDGLLTWELRSNDQFVEIVSDGTNWKTLGFTNFDLSTFKRLGSTNNRWYVAGWTGNSTMTTLAISANIYYANPVIITRPVTLTDIGINCTTGAAGTGAKVGLYKDSGTVSPGALVVEGGSELSTATGATFVSVALASPPKLQPGLYWACVVSNGTPSVTFIPLAAQFPLLGVDNTAAARSGASSYYRSQTYPTGSLADPFPSGITYNQNSQIPAIYLRFS